MCSNVSELTYSVIHEGELLDYMLMTEVTPLTALLGIVTVILGYLSIYLHYLCSIMRLRTSHQGA